MLNEIKLLVSVVIYGCYSSSEIVMGLDVKQFVGPVDEEFICSICLDVFENPVSVTCGHIFCRSCIVTANKEQNCCPMDRQPLGKNWTPIHAMRGLIDKLQTKCPFSVCQETMPRSQQEAHVINCKFNFYTCEKGCELNIPRRDKAQHNCLSALKENYKFNYDLFYREYVDTTNRTLTRVRRQKYFTRFFLFLVFCSVCALKQRSIESLIIIGFLMLMSSLVYSCLCLFSPLPNE